MEARQIAILTHQGTALKQTIIRSIRTGTLTKIRETAIFPKRTPCKALAFGVSISIKSKPIRARPWEEIPPTGQTRKRRVPAEPPTSRSEALLLRPPSYTWAAAGLRFNRQTSSSRPGSAGSRLGTKPQSTAQPSHLTSPNFANPLPTRFYMFDASACPC
jgi:hypothetical protein